MPYHENTLENVGFALEFSSFLVVSRIYEINPNNAQGVYEMLIAKYFIDRT